MQVLDNVIVYSIAHPVVLAIQTLVFLIAVRWLLRVCRREREAVARDIRGDFAAEAPVATELRQATLASLKRGQRVFRGNAIGGGNPGDGGTVVSTGRSVRIAWDDGTHGVFMTADRCTVWTVNFCF